MTVNPVQVLVVGFTDPNPTGEALAELTRLEAAGVVRLVDLMLVRRGEDGSLETVQIGADGGVEVVDPSRGGAAPGWIAAEFFSGAGQESVDDTDAWSLGDSVPPGGMAAVALIEHVWAGPLRAAIERAGGTPLEETWLAPADLAVLQGILAG